MLEKNAINFVKHSDIPDQAYFGRVSRVCRCDPRLDERELALVEHGRLEDVIQGDDFLRFGIHISLQ